jgi:hypothetical protein
MLAPIIHAARFDLRDVDLSQNKIKVTTRDEARDFATFLRSFAGCEVMRRLDLGENDFSGPLGMEIVLREYSEQQHVDASLLYYQNGPGGRDADYEILSERTNNLRVSPKSRSYSNVSEDTTSSNASYMNGRIVLRCGLGLRAISGIILKDIGLDDAGALHLSYVSEHHY